MMRRTVRVRENSLTQVSRADFDIDTLPRGVEKFVRIYGGPGGNWLFEVGPYAGLIPCRDGTIIQLDTKIKVSNLAYMLFKGGELGRSVETPFESTVPYKVAEDDLETFLEAIMGNYLALLDNVKSKGLLRQGEQQRVATDVVRGKIRVSDFAASYVKDLGRTVPQTVWNASL